MFQLNLFIQTSSRLNLVNSHHLSKLVLYWGEEVFRKEQGTKYFKLCMPHKVCFCLKLFENVKLNLRPDLSQLPSFGDPLCRQSI